MKTVKYTCKENDNLIRYFRDGDVLNPNAGEFHFSLPLKKKEWIVVGFKDMMAMMRKCGFM
jgi:hypothetical protein